MSVTSLSFLIFLPLVVVLYYAMPPSWRWIVLLVASYVFYAVAFPALLLFQWALTGFNFYLVHAMARRQDTSRKAFLVGLIVIDIGSLLFFKYSSFFCVSLFQLLSGSAGACHFSWIVPLGLSFSALQLTGYAVDVYIRKSEPESHLGRYALFTCFFPQLLAGPIERGHHLLPQLSAPHTFEESSFIAGVRRIAWGFFKKLVIANALAPVVDMIYGAPHAYPGLVLLLATYLFAFQLYVDFSGYTDIALGTAQLFGINLLENFRSPYLATSISDFWRRWHISLSSWFRDYIYIPLGGNRCGILRRCLNVLIVFLLSGLWHGAAWTYVVWGGIYGAYIAIAILLQPLRETLRTRVFKNRAVAIRTLFSILITFHLVLFAWIFFRAASLTDALFIVHAIATDLLPLTALPSKLAHVGAHMGTLNFSRTTFMAIIGVMLLMELWEYLRREHAWRPLQRMPLVARWGVYYAFVLVLLIYGSYQSYAFIYAQF